MNELSKRVELCVPHQTPLPCGRCKTDEENKERDMEIAASERRSIEIHVRDESETPEFFRNTEGERVANKIRDWLIDIFTIGKKPVYHNDMLRHLPEELKSLEDYFYGRYKSGGFEKLFLSQAVSALYFSIDDPSSLGAYIEPERRGHLAQLHVGMVLEEQPVLVRTIRIMDNGEVRRVDDFGPYDPQFSKWNTKYHDFFENIEKRKRRKLSDTEE